MTEANVDLLVLGGGMAGLAAAARTTQEGGSVVLVEKGDAVGGSATYAEFIWTAPDVETLRERNPNGDPALAEAFIAGFQPAVQWVRDGSFHGGVYWLGLKENGVGYVYDEHNRALIPPAVRARVEQVRADIIAGRIQVPSER